MRYKAFSYIRISAVSALAFLSGTMPAAFAQTDTVPAAIAAELDNSILPQQDQTLVLPRQFVNSGPASWQRGLAAYHNGDFEKAEIEFKAALNRFSSSVLATRFGGQEAFSELFRVGRFSQSGTRIRVGRGDPPGVSSSERSLARTSYAVGAALIKQQEYGKARQYFAKALAYDKALHDARLRLGLIALAEGKPNKAERRLRQLETWCESLVCKKDDELGQTIATLRDAIDVYTLRQG